MAHRQVEMESTRRAGNEICRLAADTLCTSPSLVIITSSSIRLDKTEICSIHSGVKGILHIVNMRRFCREQTVLQTTEESWTGPDTVRRSRDGVRILSEAMTEMLSKMGPVR